MIYLFLDESGDLGFNFSKKRTSRVFVITILCVEDKRLLEKIVKKVHAQLSKRLKRRLGVLHAVHESPSTRRRLLRYLAEKDCSLTTIYLNKKKVYTRLQNEKIVLYNYVTNILLDRIYSRRLINVKDGFQLIAAKRETNKFLNDNFKNYLEQQASGNRRMALKVTIRSPHEEKGLQAVDFASWAVFRKYEYGDDSYYKIIKSRIIEERPLFP